MSTSHLLPFGSDDFLPVFGRNPSVMAQGRWIISSTHIVLLVIGRKGHQRIGQHCTSQTQVRKLMRTSLFEKPSNGDLPTKKKKTLIETPHPHSPHLTPKKNKVPCYGCIYNTTIYYIYLGPCQGLLVISAHKTSPRSYSPIAHHGSYLPLLLKAQVKDPWMASVDGCPCME